MPSTINELKSVMHSSPRGAQLTLKQLALLVHPDKSEHPRGLVGLPCQKLMWKRRTTSFETNGMDFRLPSYFS